MNTFCTVCGNQLVSGKRFCGKCGAKIVESSSRSAQEPPVAPERGLSPQSRFLE